MSFAMSEGRPPAPEVIVGPSNPAAREMGMVAQSGRLRRARDAIRSRLRSLWRRPRHPPSRPPPRPARGHACPSPGAPPQAAPAAQATAAGLGHEGLAVRAPPLRAAVLLLDRRPHRLRRDGTARTTAPVSL